MHLSERFREARSERLRETLIGEAGADPYRTMTCHYAIINGQTSLHLLMANIQLLQMLMLQYSIISCGLILSLIQNWALSHGGVYQ
jgi:hypothetical protein